MARPRKDPADRQSSQVAVNFKPSEMSALLRAMANRIDAGGDLTLGGFIRELALQALGVSCTQNPPEAGGVVSRTRNSEPPDSPEGVSCTQNPSPQPEPPEGGEPDLAALLDDIEVGSRVSPTTGLYVGVRGRVTRLVEGKATVEFKSAQGNVLTVTLAVDQLQAL